MHAPSQEDILLENYWKWQNICDCYVALFFKQYDENTMNSKTIFTKNKSNIHKNQELRKEKKKEKEKMEPPLESGFNLQQLILCVVYILVFVYLSSSFNDFCHFMKFSPSVIFFL